MDSLTQAVLGAAVAEAGMGGRRLGNRAIAWGVVLGTLPDLDVLAHPWLDAVQRLSWHRGLSHALLFMLVASPLIGWGIARFHRGQVSVVRAALTTFAVLFTHVLIDVFTVYGTQVFEPFSDVRVAFNNLFIIDPLYTLPLLIGVGAALWLRPGGRWRSRMNMAGLALSTLYVGWSFGAKAVATTEIAASLREQGLPHARLMTAPTPFNTVLWRGLAEAPGGFWVGYYSLADRGRPVRFDFIPRGEEWLPQLEADRAGRRLAWFAQGYHGVQPGPDGLVVSDWRFGETRERRAPLGADNTPEAIFAWRLVAGPNGWEPVPVRGTRSRAELLPQIWRRMWGGDVGW